MAYFTLESDAAWEYMSCSSELYIALCLQIAYGYYRGPSLQIKCSLVFFCMASWLEVPLKTLWILVDLQTIGIAPIAALLTAIVLYVIARPYDIESDDINYKNVTLLLLKPTSFLMVIKSFIGAPVSSVCILANGYVWSYRQSKGQFCRSKCTDKWLSNHIAIDTGEKLSIPMAEALNDHIDTKRGLGIKCIYTIRDVLNLLGSEWKPKTFLHFIPGIYVRQILGAKK